MKMNKVLLGLLPAVFVFAFILLRPQIAHAATYTAAWVNRSTIEVTASDGPTIVLVDVNWDNDWEFVGVADGRCEARIDGFDGDTIIGFSGTDGQSGAGAWTAAASRANLTIERWGGTSCADDSPSPKELTITDDPRAQMTFYLDGNRVIRFDDSDSWTFTQGDTPAGRTGIWYFRDSEGGEDECVDVVVTDAARTTMKLYEQTTDDEAGVSPIDANCDLIATIDQLFTGPLMDNGDHNTMHGHVPSDFEMPLGTTDDLPNPGGGGGPGNNGPRQDSCVTAPGIAGTAIRWLLCPVMELLDGAVHWLDTQLQNMLLVDDPAAPGYGPGQELHTAWGRLRNIALIILIPIMLVMVIGTALGVNFLDAYTVRRAMPRFLIAIVFISTSWYFTSFLINLTNAVGTGILGIMTQPFGGPDAQLTDYIGTAGGIISSWGTLVIFGGLLATGAVSFMIILSYAGIAVLVLLIGFVLLTIRQVLILALVLFAPLAILSWIFPSNDALWKLWWGTFSKLLLMFPLIMILVAAGKIFAYVIANS